MVYGKAKGSHRPRNSRLLEPDFQRHGLARVQRRQHYRPVSVPLAPTGNNRRIAIALKTNHAPPAAIGAPPSSPAEQSPLEPQTTPQRAPNALSQDALPERASMGGTWSSAWLVVAALFLALFLVSSLSTTRSSLTEKDIARAAHHMPRERAVDGRF
jgi:hypothetical protein